MGIRVCAGVLGAVVLALAAYGTYQLGAQFGSTSSVSGNEAQVRFSTSSDPQERVLAVRSLKADYQATTSPAAKAKIINGLTGMIHSAHESYIFDEVFAGEPFEQYLSSEGAEVSVGKLNALSYSLHPTAYAAQAYAFAQTIELRRLSHVPKRTAAQERVIRADVDFILKQVDIAQKLIDEDLMGARSGSEALNMEGAYYQWQGHLLGDVALVRPEYLPTSLSYINTALLILSSFRNEQGDISEVTWGRIAALHWGYVRYASGAAGGGLAAHPEAKAHGDEFTRILRAHWDSLSSFRIMLESARAHLSGEHDPSMGGALHKELMESQIAVMRDLANVSPDAAAFFASKGLDLSKYPATSISDVLPVTD